ncbi:MAG TPA: lysophospholipid acyltransferase family protein [Dissulfurispiraceae bacterium]|nr:lysophospholipid acyltransferase family protein [Dissulfurispiraceae bacterium]
MKKIRWFFEAAAVLAVALPFAVLPRAMALRAGELLGLFAFAIWGSRRKIAIDNIGKAVQAGGITINESAAAIARKSFMNLGRSLAEIVKIYFGLGQGLIDSIEVEGIDNYLKAKEKGKGILFITGHCGNWELTALGFGARVAPLAVIARAQNNPYLNRMVEKARSRYGNRIIYKQGALMAILSELRQNGIVGILMDQSVLPEEGYIIDFLGRGAWTTKIPALLARKRGAAVIPAFIHREGNRYMGKIYPEVQLSTEQDQERAVVEDTKRFSGYIENYIRAYPSEWLWIHRRWKRT